MRAHVRKELVGKDVKVLAAAAGVSVPESTQILFGETDEDHAFVVEEQMMPFIPIVRVKDVDAGIAAVGEGGARLPAHRDHSLQERGQRDAHGEGDEHHALR